VRNKKVFLEGMFLGGEFALFFRRGQLTSIAEVALLGTIAPVFTEGGGKRVKKKGFSRKGFFGKALALLGAYTLISQSSFSDTSSLGNLLAVLCSVAMAVVLLVGKDVRKSGGLLEYSGGGLRYAAAGLPIISLNQGVNV
jgi:hypothetical protein